MEVYLDGGPRESLILWENPGAATILNAMNILRVTEDFEKPDFQNDVAWTDLSFGLRRATHPTSVGSMLNEGDGQKFKGPGIFFFYPWNACYASGASHDSYEAGQWENRDCSRFCWRPERSFQTLLLVNSRTNLFV